MADTPNVCGYWHYTQITPDDVDPAQFDHRCVAANGLFTGRDWGPDDISCFAQDTTYSNLTFPLGRCDGQGGIRFCWETCNRYHPAGMGFGKLAPVGDSTKVNEFLVSDEGYQEWTEFQQYRLPFKHQVYNLRARMSKCCYWDDTNSADFTLNAATGNLELLDESIELEETERFPTTKCSWADDRINQNRPKNPSVNLPCNGALPNGTGLGECRWYTGVNWEHCVEDKMQDGDKITAAQIQEIRFYSDEWSNYNSPYAVFKGRFIDPEIYAWFYSDDFERGVYYATPPGWIGGLARETEYPVIGYQNVPILDRVKISLPDGEIESGKKIIPSGGTPSKQNDIQQPNFPTLIRELNESISLRPRIIFPHKDYIHRHWTPDGAKVPVIGVALQASTVYVVNDKKHKVPIQVKQAQAKEAEGKFLTSAEQSELNTKIEEYLDEIKTYFYEDYIQVSPDDNHSGYFLAETIGLELDSNQDIYIFSNVGSDWYFASVNIDSKFYHSFPIQTGFDAKSWTDAYIWDGFARGDFFHAKGSPTVSKFIWRMKHEGFTYSEATAEFGTLWRYSYNVIKTAEQTVDVDENNWWPLSSCGEVLVRIDDDDINRVEGWEITSAVVSRGSRSTELNTTPLYPSSLTGSTEYFPANYVVLQPKEDEKAFHYKKDSATTLTIKYRRFEDRRNPYILENGEEIAEPSGISYINVGTGGDRYTEFYGDDEWQVGNIYEWNPIFKAYFADETGRIIGAKTFRLLIQYKNVLCRDYEIKYHWTAEYNFFKWHPSIWACQQNGITWTITKEGRGTHTMTPACGDHEVGRAYQIGIGPMWYPYNECDNEITYKVGEIGNVCTLPVEGSPTSTTPGEHSALDHRLRGPDDSYAATYGDPNPAIFACRLPYQYGYHEKQGINMFRGWGASRGEVDVAEYLLNQWALPKFGNVLREQSLVNRSTVFEQYFDTDTLSFKWKWMPQLEEYSELEDVFSEDEVHPFLFLMATTIADQNLPETFDSTRYDFEEVLFTRWVQATGSVWYPRPETGSRFNIWYQFLDDDLTSGISTQWLYREVWQDPERPKIEAKDEDNSIPFAFLYNVDPAIDQFNMEHRKAADEGAYALKWSAPVWNDGGDIETDGYFQFGAGAKRYFDVGAFDWKDGTVMVNGEEQTSKYSDWSGGGSWDTLPNLWSIPLVTGDTAEAESYGYNYTTYDSQSGEESEHHFFPGVNIVLRDFKFPVQLSADLTGLEYDTSFKISPPADHPTRNADNLGWNDYNDSQIDSPGSAAQTNKKSLVWSHSQAGGGIEILLDIGSPITLAEIRFSALTGTYSDTFILGADLSIYVGMFPNCEVLGSNDEFGSYTSLFTITGVPYSQVSRQPGKFSEFKVTSASSSVTSFANRYRYFKLKFDAFSDEGAVLFISQIKFKRMELLSRTETPINLKEQKFYKTTAPITGSFNYHGTQSYPMMGPDNASIYLTEPRLQGLLGTSGFQAYHKCRARGGGIYHRDKDDIIFYTGADNTCSLEQQQELNFTEARNTIGASTDYEYNLINPLVSYLNEFEIIFPFRVLTMNNSVPEFTDDEFIAFFGAPPESCHSWSGAGHSYTNSKHLVWQEVCGGILTGCGAFRTRQWTCDYCFKHINHIGFHGEEDECNLAINPATIYATIIIPNVLSGTDEFGEIGAGDIRARAARDWVAGEWIQENIAN